MCVVSSTGSPRGSVISRRTSWNTVVPLFGMGSLTVAPIHGKNSPYCSHHLTLRVEPLGVAIQALRAEMECTSVMPPPQARYRRRGVVRWVKRSCRKRSIVDPIQTANIGSNLPLRHFKSRASIWEPRELGSVECGGLWLAI
jgi:hypothetical protein